jgi:hypothetical protein
MNQKKVAKKGIREDRISSLIPFFLWIINLYDHARVIHKKIEQTYFKELRKKVSPIRNRSTSLASFLPSAIA